MHFTSKNVVWNFYMKFFITIISFTAVFGSSEKRFNLKIGFDVSKGPDGGPALRIREFEDSSEIKARARDDEGMDTKPTIVRADSSTDSKESYEKFSEPKHVKSSKEARDSSSSKSNDDNSDSSEEDKKLSTRGMKPEDYEPEELAQIHHKYKDNTEEISDKLRRRKRYANFRRIVKQVGNAS